MNKKLKYFFSLLAGTIFLALLIFIVIFISNGKYRKQLPDYPDFNNVPKSLSEQISDAGRKAYFNPSAINLGNLGMIYYSDSFYEKANQCFRLALHKNKNLWILNYYLGYLNLEQGESEMSVKNFQKVIENNPKNYMANYYLAVAYENLGSITDAEKLFEKIAALTDHDSVNSNPVRENFFPVQTYAKYHLARIYMNSNRLDEAETALKELIQSQMTFGPTYRLLGNVFTLKGNLPLGENYKIRANDLAEYTPPVDMMIDELALISRSDTYLLKEIDDAIRSGNFKWALKIIKHSLQYYPENKYLVSKAIYGYFSMGFDNLALSHLGKHIQYFSDDFNELIDVADLLISKGFHQQAMNYFNQAKKLKPGNSRLALWLMDRGMGEESLQLLNDQLEKEPDNINTLTEAVHMMLKVNKEEMAITFLNRLKKIPGSKRDADKLAGMMAEKEGNLKLALSIYERSFREDPKDLNIVKYLGKLYIREKMWSKALAHFRVSLNSFPNEPFLLSGLGNILVTCPDGKFLNVNEGREYSERAFINFHSTITMKISAGADLATAYAIEGDKANASKYISLTSGLVKNLNLPRDYISYFKNLKKQYNIP